MEIFSHLYSSSILDFIKKLNLMAKEILIVEMQLGVRGSHILFGDYRYPINIVVFEDKSRLGYFNPEFHEIGIHKAMIFSKDQDFLKNLIRHELAHYYVFMKYGSYLEAHGKEFRQVCSQFGWKKKVSLSTFEISDKNLMESEQFASKISKKVQKLFALASSSSIHESENATVKANELLMKYNLETLLENEDKEMQIKKVLFSPRANAKLYAISSILRSFFVFPVLNHGQSNVYLEIFGEKTNIEIADYVANFLDHKMDLLWQEARKKYHLKGIVAKNSFFRGLASGYKEKIDQLHNNSSHNSALMKIDKMLQMHAQKAYPRLNSTATRSKHSEHANQSGKKEGKNLKIDKGIEKGSFSKKFYLN